jgi:hypothetical protein
VTPLATGALLAVAVMVWVIAPIFTGEPDDESGEGAASRAADDAAEAAIRRWRERGP